MTRDFAVALMEGTRPFDGVTLLLSNLALDALCQIYRVASTTVDQASPHAELFQCADWHLHDGYITKPEPCSRAEWLSWGDNVERLAAAWFAEDYVHRGVGPVTRDWYLRFLLWEDYHEEPHDNQLDVTGPPNLIMKVRAALADAGLPQGEVFLAGEWFESHGDTWLPDT